MMTPIEKIERWRFLYNRGVEVNSKSFPIGITDGPTRGLIVELLFYDLLSSSKVKKRLSKGTFEKESNKSKKGRNSKYQYDWLFLKKPVSEFPVLNLWGVPFGSYDPDDIQAVIEIRTGLTERIKDITDDQSFLWKHNQEKAHGKPWVFVSFTTSIKIYRAFLEKSLDLSRIKAANGSVFFLHGFGLENQAPKYAE